MNTAAFFSTLPIAIKGMAGIFIVTLAIIISMYALQKFCK